LNKIFIVPASDQRHAEDMRDDFLCLDIESREEALHVLMDIFLLARTLCWNARFQTKGYPSFRETTSEALSSAFVKVFMTDAQVVLVARRPPGLPEWHETLHGREYSLDAILSGHS
jgi:hypothetical protein